MLTPKQLYIHLLCFHFYTKLGFIPFDIDVRAGKIVKTRSNKTLQLWWFWLTFGVLRGILAFVIFILALARPEKIPMEDIPIIIAFPMCCVLGCYSFHRLFIRYSDTTVIVFNALSTGKLKVARKISMKLPVTCESDGEFFRPIRAEDMEEYDVSRVSRFAKYLKHTYHSTRQFHLFVREIPCNL